MKLNDLPTIYLKPARVAAFRKAEESTVKTEKSGIGELKVGRKYRAEITPKIKVVSHSCVGTSRDCIVQTAHGRKFYFCMQ